MGVGTKKKTFNNIVCTIPSNHIAGNFGGFGKFGELFVICQTKTI